MQTLNINDYAPHRQGRCSLVKSEEHGCVHLGQNPGHHMIRQYRIDGEVIPKESSELRCDFLVLNDTVPKAYYIELKGSDINRAIDQIENSVRLFKTSLTGYTEFRRIIYRSGTHSVESSKAVLWKRKHPGALIKSIKWTDNLS